MTDKIISARKYLPAAALLVLIAFCGYFYFALDHVSDVILQGKIADCRINVDLVCDEIEYFVGEDSDGAAHDYKNMLACAATLLDVMGGCGTYAEAFDGGMNSVSEKAAIVEGVPFDPREYPSFNEAVSENACGEIILWFEKGGIPPHNLHLYYRWAPSDKNFSQRLLLVVGVSKHSQGNGISDWVAVGAVSLTIVSAVLIIGAVILICRLGYVYQICKLESRAGNGEA